MRDSLGEGLEVRRVVDQWDGWEMGRREIWPGDGLGPGDLIRGTRTRSGDSWEDGVLIWGTVWDMGRWGTRLGDKLGD